MNSAIPRVSRVKASSGEVCGRPKPALIGRRAQPVNARFINIQISLFRDINLLIFVEIGLSRERATAARTINNVG